MAEWSFLINHARALVCIAHDPGVRLCDIAIMLGITERSSFAIVNDLVTEGYVIKDKDDRRKRCQVEHHLPLRKTLGRERSIRDVLAILVDSDAAEVGTRATAHKSGLGLEGASRPNPD
jgi:hypothetical protein